MIDPENKSPAIPVSPQPVTKFQPVKFVHEKSPQFRTYHTDGAWGVVNALGDIHLSFFTEHPRLAAGVINKVNPENGIYTGEHEMVGDTDPNYFITVRDFQCSVVLSIQTAERIHTLLGNFIGIAKKSVADFSKAKAEQKK